MTAKTVYACDHCGAECSGDDYASIGQWHERGKTIFGKTVHGCSKEHFGLALASMFGVGVDGKALELLRGAAKRSEEQEAERERLQNRIADLETTVKMQEAAFERLRPATDTEHGLGVDPNITDPSKPTKPVSQ